MPGFDDAMAGARRWSCRSIRAIIAPRVAPPVRAVASIPVAADVEGRTGVPPVDGGQNISGLRAPARPGHAGRAGSPSATPRCSSRTARCTPARSARRRRPTPTSSRTTRTVVLEPMFTFHGFRYAEVETDAEVIEATFVAISSDTAASRRVRVLRPAPEPAPRERRLVAAGQLRLGADRLPAARRAARLDRRRPGLRADGLHPVRRPGLLGELAARPRAGPGRRCSACRAWSRTSSLQGEPRFGRAGWADAATIVPWAVYESYGDAARPARPARQHAALGRLAPWPPAARTGSCRPSMQFGDWLDPDAPVGSSVGGQGRLRLPRQRLLRLQRPAGRRRRGRSSGTPTGPPRRHERWPTRSPRDVGAVGGRTRATTQTGCAVALRFGLVPDGERAAVGRGARAARPRRDGRVATGFLGTPLVLPGPRRRRPLRRGATSCSCGARCRPGSTRSSRVRRRSGSAGTPSDPTARSTPGR